MWMVDKAGKLPLYMQLYQQIREDIINGTLKAGLKLKSSREISEELHISRNTVELAYGQLFAEGFIASKPRRGYYVELSEPKKFHECEESNPSEAEIKSSHHVAYDFRCGKLLLSELPCNQWQRLTGRCFHDFKESLAAQGSAFGEPGLRTEIQRYIHHYRNVQCSAEQIVVATGTQACLGLACQILKAINSGSGIAIEEPGYDQSRSTFSSNGLKIVPIALDERGLSADALAAADVMAAYATPSHQSPTGIVMPLSRRRELAEWAKQKKAYILEDDYNCHFQHDIKPLPSMQSLCPESVFYIGSFSDILFPCMRVSYMVIPENLLGGLHGWFDGHAPFVPFLTQKPLELFMKEGHWESHLRKMRKNQKGKCEALVGALNHKFGSRLHISGAHAGLHLLVEAGWPVTEDELIRRAAQAGVRVYPTSRYWSHPENGKNGTVLLNYGGIPPADIPAAVQLLYEAWLCEDRLEL
jgi:Transcriptional regulators containing a DNA-binding HTH domain and an aminotransferase domain (MocR family) and their eukaryotic orthologs